MSDAVEVADAFGTGITTCGAGLLAHPGINSVAPRRPRRFPSAGSKGGARHPLNALPAEKNPYKLPVRSYRRSAEWSR